MHHKKRMLIYSTARQGNSPRSKGSVGGFADRIKGLTFTYYLAKLVGREFAIEWLHPDRLEESFRFPSFRGMSDDLNYTSVDLIDKNFNHAVKLDFLNNQARRFASDIQGKDIVKINCNSLPLDILQANHLHFHKLGLPTQTYANIFRHIFDTILIYRPPNSFQPIQYEFNSFRKKMFTIGVQFRLGGAENGWDDPVIDSPKNITNLIDAITRIAAKIAVENYNVYITSDSRAARDAISQKLKASGTETFYLNFDPIHIDKQDPISTKSDASYVYFDNHLLSQCDLIVVGHGFFGRLAAYRAGKSPYNYRDFFADNTRDYNEEKGISKIINLIKRL